MSGFRVSGVLWFSTLIVGCGGAPAVHSAPAAPKDAPRTALVHVQRLAADDDRLWIDFAAVANEVDDAFAARVLSPLSAKATDVSLARTKVGDATVALCARMPELRRLDLRGTKVTAAGLEKLAGHQKLATLGLGETRLGGDVVATLATLPALASVNLWQSDLDAAALAAVRTRFPNVRFEVGDGLTTAVLEEEPAPKFSSEAPLPGASKAAEAATATINSKCPVSGKPVVAGHTVVDQGKTVGFCCDQCAAKFRAAPEQFRAALK